MTVNNSSTQKGINAINIIETVPVCDITNTKNDKKVFGVISNLEENFNKNTKEFSDKYSINTRLYINSIGEGAIWVSDINGPLENGDYISSSIIPGYGQLQDDDLFHNYTVAKITMDCDFTQPFRPKLKTKKEMLEISTNEILLDNNKEPIYNYLPLLDENGNNVVDESGNIIYTDEKVVVNKKIYENKEVLDENGKLVWIEEVDASGNVVMEPAYEMRYLQMDGVEITAEDYETRRASGENVYKAAFVGCTYHCG
jgi:hypothetical protein